MTSKGLDIILAWLIIVLGSLLLGVLGAIFLG